MGLAACAGSPHGPIVHVTIPPGATFRVAADSLHRAGLVEAPRLFRLYAQLTGRDRDIKAGTYGLQRDMGWSALVQALHEGQGLERRLTIPEGWSLREIVPALTTALGAWLDKGQIKALLQRRDKMQKVIDKLPPASQ